MLILQMLRDENFLDEITHLPSGGRGNQDEMVLLKPAADPPIAIITVEDLQKLA